MKVMKDLINEYIIPFKTEYVILGALIVTFSVLGESFGDNFVTPFLMALVSFVMFLMFFNLLIDIYFVSVRLKGVNVLEATYFAFFLLFSTGFFFLVFTEYSKQFPIFLGILLGYGSITIWREARWWLIILHRKINKKHKIPFAPLNFVLLFVYAVFLKKLSPSFLTMITKNFVDPTISDIFISTFYILFLMGFVVLIIIFLKDLFKKEILHSKIKKEKTLLYKTYENIRNKKFI